MDIRQFSSVYIHHQKDHWQVLQRLCCGQLLPMMLFDEFRYLCYVQAEIFCSCNTHQHSQFFNLYLQDKHYSTIYSRHICLCLFPALADRCWHPAYLLLHCVCIQQGKHHIADRVLAILMACYFLIQSLMLAFVYNIKHIMIQRIHSFLFLLFYS